MDYKVVKGELMATITLDGNELEVIFDSHYNVFNVRSDNDVTVALSPGKSEGDDGVMMSRENDPVFYPHMRSLDRVYLKGNGTAVIFASNVAVPVFKKVQRGGGTTIAKDYVKDGLLAKWMLDDNETENFVLTNPVYVDDDILGRKVGKVTDKASSFFVRKENLGGTEYSGVTLQCLMKCNSFPRETSFLAMGYNDTSWGAAFGLGLNNVGKFSIRYVNGGLDTDLTPELNVWYHFAAVYDNATQITTVYVNGEVIERFNRGFNPSTLKRGAAIGTWVWSSPYPTASQSNQGDFLVANCCIYERPLRDLEVSENYAVDKKRYRLQ